MAQLEKWYLGKLEREPNGSLVAKLTDRRGRIVRQRSFSAAQQQQAIEWLRDQTQEQAKEEFVGDLQERLYQSMRQSALGNRNMRVTRSQSGAVDVKFDIRF